MKARVMFDTSSHREPFVYDFDALPREGECMAAPVPVGRPDLHSYHVDRVIHFPARTDVKIEIVVHRIAPRQRERPKATTIQERHTIFVEALRTMLQAKESEVISAPIDFPSDQEPDELDRTKLARLLAWLLLDSVLREHGVMLSISVSANEKRGALSYKADGEMHDGSPPPWRVAVALIDELSVAAGLSEESMNGTLSLELDDGKVVLQVEEKEDAEVTSILVTQIHEESKRTTR